MIIVHPVIMCGGSGKRLWPASRDSKPKQFLSVLGGEALVCSTARRLHDGDYAEEIVVEKVLACCGIDHRFMIRRAMSEAKLPAPILLCEPSGKNTAAVVALASEYVRQNYPDGESHVLVFVPSDHLISNGAAYIVSLSKAILASATGDIVALGATPMQPSTAYGYIRAESSTEDVSRIAEFVEKPDEVKAQQLLDHGGYYWNCGMYVGRTDTFVRELEKHSPHVLNGVRAALETSQRDGDDVLLAESEWSDITSIPFDYAVMERTVRAMVVSTDCGWNDIGSWDAIHDASSRDAEGNAVDGDAVLFNCTNSYVRNESRLLPVLCGVDNVAVVVTTDALLVSNLEQSQMLKQVVAEMESAGRTQVADPAKVERPWGTYEVLDSGDGFQVKRLEVFVGQRLSLQYHHHRSEHWHVVAGTAEVVVGDDCLVLEVGQSVDIGLGQVHRLSNAGEELLIVIEMQRGDIIEESDIVRIEDIYNRTPSASS